MSQENQKHTAPPRYDEAFKTGAVKMVTEQGRPSREVAAELGSCIDTLRSWLGHRHRGRLIARTARSAAFTTSKPKSVNCAKSLQKKMRSSTF